MNECDKIELGRATQILDNLIAQGKAEPMILVMTNGNISQEARPEFIPVNKPVKELKAFAKTKLLKPGERETLKLTVKAADLASFDEAASAWVVAEGEYQFLVAASAQDIKATLTAKAKAQQTKANDVMKPQGQMNLLKR